MASKADVQAGGAFVRLFLKDDMSKDFSAAMKSAGESMQSVGEAVASVGVMIGAAGAAILAPIGFGVDTFMELGSAAMDAASRTGLSVAALGELGFAASMTGASIDDVEIGVKKMSTGIQDLATGSKTAAEAFGRLGLTSDDLMGLSPDEQFTKIATAIGNIQDPTMRAASAVEMFGRSGTVLLPMISDMEALRAKARELGIVMSDEDAAAADELGDAWDILKGQAKAVFFQLGAAVAGPLKEYAGEASRIASSTIAWVRENRGLITSLAQAAAIVVAAGTGLVALGGLIAAVGTGLTYLAAALPTLIAVGAVLATWASFQNLGVVDFGPMLSSLRATGDYLGGEFMATMREIKSIGDTVFAGMIASLQSGDLKSAAEIGLLGLEAAMLSVKVRLLSIWSDFNESTKQTYEGMWIQLAEIAEKYSPKALQPLIKWANENRGNAADQMVEGGGEFLRRFAPAAVRPIVNWALDKVEGQDAQLDAAKTQLATAKAAANEAARIAEQTANAAQYANDFSAAMDQASREMAAVDNPFSDVHAATWIDEFSGSIGTLNKAIREYARLHGDAMQAASDWVGAMDAAQSAGAQSAFDEAMGLEASPVMMPEGMVSPWDTTNQALDQEDFDFLTGEGGWSDGINPGSTVTPTGLTTYNAAAAQAAGFMGGGTPEQRTATGIEKLIEKTQQQIDKMEEGNIAAKDLIAGFEQLRQSFSYG